jgi:hypothetical protein
LSTGREIFLGLLLHLRCFHAIGRIEKVGI